MNRIAKLFIVGLLAFLGFLAIAPTVSAEFTSPFQDTCDGSSAARSSSVCQDEGRKTTGIDGSKQTTQDLVNKVANIIAAVGGIIAVVMIMVNGLTLIMSTGDSAKINKARDGMIYAAVGIVVIVMARVIVGFILRFV